MKTVSLSMMVAVFLVFCATGVWAESVTDEQQARLAEIKQYTEAQKQSIEKRYAARLAVVNEQMRSGLLRLEIGDNHKFVRTGFFGWSEYNKEVLRLNGVDLSSDKDYARSLKKFRSNLLPQEQLNETAKLLVISERRLADERLRTRLLLALERAEIEKHRRYAIEVRQAELEAKLKDNVLNPPKPAPEGTVTGIVCSEDDVLAVVGSRIVRKGEHIGDVCIVGVTADGVEFERGKKRWTQMPGDKAGAGW